MKFFRKKRPIVDWMKKHKIASIIILVVVLGVLAMAGKQGQEVLETTTATAKPVSVVSLSDIRESQVVATASGEVESLEQVTLSSEIFGTVTGVYADIGDTVSRGQLLVQFRAADRAAQRTQAAADYEGTLAAKDALLAQIDAAQANHDKLVVSANNSVTAAEAALSTAENDLQQNQGTGLNTLTKNAYDDLVRTLESVEDTLVSELTVADSILGIDNQFVNDSYEKGLGVMDQAKLSYAAAKKQRNDFVALMTTVTTGSTELAIDTAANIAQDALAVYSELFSDLTDVLQRSLPVGGMTQTTLDTLTTSVNTSRSDITAKQTSITNGIQGISTAETSFSAKEITYEKAVQDLADTKAKAAADIAASEAGLKQLEANLASQDANIKRALGSLAAINAELAKTAIRAPISGTIAELPVKTGELVSSGAVVARVVNTEGLQVTAFVPSSVLDSLAVNSPVQIDGTPVGRVVRIAPSINPTTKKVEVLVAIDDAAADTFVVGQFVDLELLASEDAVESTTLLVPFQAVRVSADGHAVFVVQDGKVVPVSVETGSLVGDKIEIISDVSAYDEIIASVRGVSEGDEVLVTSNE